MKILRIFITLSAIVFLSFAALLLSAYLLGILIGFLGQWSLPVIGGLVLTFMLAGLISTDYQGEAKESDTPFAKFIKTGSFK